MPEKYIITSALPYVNGVKHLGNLIGSLLPADIYARFARSQGADVLAVCGTDEHGTPAELAALEEELPVAQYCEKYYEKQKAIYEGFGLTFDHFGRTSNPANHRMTQRLFLRLKENGLIAERVTKHLYCIDDERFLPDRFVIGTCPHCAYERARGDQCESCTKLLNPEDLIDPRSSISGSTRIEQRESKHLFLLLPKMADRLAEWLKTKEGQWPRTTMGIAQKWLNEGLRERCITRDLEWGIPVPMEGYEDKVFYVWFDAPIGYISITADLTDEWESWWKNPDQVELYQFIGKDNIPFHTVIFPCTLLASGDNWTMLHHMSSTEYLNYESGKFSKSKGVGVFGNDAKDTGIPADVWRFYIFYNRPEKSDAVFTWDDFQEKVNGELIGNLSNLVNRTLTFVVRFFDGKIPEFSPDQAFVEEVKRQEAEITEALEHADLRDGFRRIFALASYGNREFQAGEPWRTRTSDPAAAEKLIAQLTYLVRDLAIMIEPYIPDTSDRILGFLGQQGSTWERLGQFSGLTTVNAPQILFEKLEDSQIGELRERFSGSQAERLQKAKEKEAMDEEKKVEEEQVSIEDKFTSSVDLRIARITEIERHPEADKLYIETIDAGDPETRTIVSGLVPYYEEEELLGKNIILVYNLKPAKLRGVKSNGMLLAAEKEGDENRETVEVLFVDDVEPGARLSLEGRDLPEEPLKRLKIDQFFDIPITVKDNTVMVGDAALTVAGRKVTTSQVKQGKVG